MTTSIEGYPTDDVLGRFSNQVARHINRPAYHDALLAIGRIITGDIEASDKTGGRSWFEKVEQVRLDILGARLAPISVSLRLICTEDLTDEEKDKWSSLKKRIRRQLTFAGASLGSIKFDPRSNVDVAEYREWHPLFVKGLQNRHFE